MVDRDDFNLDKSSRREPYPRKQQQDWSSNDADETNDFARRQEGAKRETVKREREMQKIIRQDQEGELIQRNQNRDRRALEKDTKRRYNELKRIADTLGIKQALQRVSEPLLRDVARHDACPARRQLARHGQPDSRGRAGDQRALSVQGRHRHRKNSTTAWAVRGWSITP